MEHVFDKPFKFLDEEHTSITMDLDALTGHDLEEIKRQWASAGNFSPMPTADMAFCALVAARAANQKVEFVQALPAKEYSKITQAVFTFLQA